MQATGWHDLPATGLEAFDHATTALAGVGLSRNKAELVDRLRQATADLGAEQAYFAWVMQCPDGVDSYRFLLACNPAWCFEYEEHDCHLRDPWLAYAKCHGRPALASEIALRDEERATFDLARRHGFVATVIVPAPSRDGLCQSGVLVLGSRSASFLAGENFLRVRILARSLALEIQDRLIDLLTEERRVICQLSRLEVELLRWVRDGLTTKAIAKRLDCSLEAIDCRFRRLNEKLGTTSRKASARIAVEYRLI